MFNVTVLSLKDIKKYLLGIFFTIILVIIATRFFMSKKENLPKTENKIETAISNQMQNLEKHMIKSGISQTIPAFSSVNEDKTKIKQEENKENKSIMESLLTSEINIMKEIDKNEAEKNIEETNENTVAEENQTTNSTCAS